MISRRVWLMMPVGLAGWAALLWRPERALPSATEEGSGELVPLVILAADGERRVASLRKIVKPDEEWRRELTASQFSVTRRAATEFAFANRYWRTKTHGVYFCVCCGTALFSSRDKFESGTGWPSFSAPLARQNVCTRADRSLAEVRTEVICRKCDAHIGHVFDDGPQPSGLRYCLNSAALRFVAGYAQL